MIWSIWKKIASKTPKLFGITEFKLRANRNTLSNIDLQYYVYEWTPTENSKGGTLMYIDNKQIEIKNKRWPETIYTKGVKL